jgi:hypothetical protein
VQIPRTIAVGAKLLAVVFVAATTVAQAMQFSGMERRAGDGIGLQAAAGSTPGFRLSGRVKGLYPGARTTLVVRAANPNRFAIRVRSVRATVGRAGSTCSESNVRVRAFRGNRRLQPKSTARFRLKIRMRADAPDSCVGARFPLTYHGEAVRA